MTWTRRLLPRKSLTKILLLVAYALLNVAWILAFRRGQPLDIDESGYISISLLDYRGLMSGGVLGWIAAVDAPSIQAPLTTAVASLTYLLFGVHALAGFSVIILSSVVTLVVTYKLGTYIGDSRTGFLASFLLATSPLVINYSRDFTFALPAAAVTALALLALIRSNRFMSVGWSLAFGALVGLMPLTRTMTLAYIPGLLVPSIIYVFYSRAFLSVRIRNLTLGLLLGSVIAALWIVPNGQLVFDYLLSYGYGNRVAEYAAGHQARGILVNLMSPQATISYIIQNFYLPDFLLLAVGAIGAVSVLLASIRTAGSRETVKKVLNSNVFPIIFLSLEGIMALDSSQNKGSGFLAPLAPAMFLVVTWAILKLGRSRRWRWSLISTAIVTGVLSFIPEISLTWPTAAPLAVNLPEIGFVTVVDGRGNIQLYESAGGYSTTNPDIPVSHMGGVKWVSESMKTARLLSSLGGTHALTAFAFRNRLYNVNTVNLEQLLGGNNPLPLTQVTPQVTGDTTSGYTAWLTSGSARTASFLITASGTFGDFYPPVKYNAMIEAARASDFKPVDRWTLPGGRLVTLWRRQHTLFRN